MWIPSRSAGSLLTLSIAAIKRALEIVLPQNVDGTDPERGVNE
jgi:hypothetical protein